MGPRHALLRACVAVVGRQRTTCDRSWHGEPVCLLLGPGVAASHSSLWRPSAGNASDTLHRGFLSGVVLGKFSKHYTCLREERECRLSVIAIQEGRGGSSWASARRPPDVRAALPGCSAGDARRDGARREGRGPMAPWVLRGRLRRRMRHRLDLKAGLPCLRHLAGGAGRCARARPDISTAASGASVP